MKDLQRITDKEDVQSLTVAVRVRPINDTEIENGCTDIAHVIDVENMVVLMDPCDDPDDILRVNRSREKQYVFDLALGPAATQRDVYERTTKDLIDAVIDGFNATVFAYGPTGAGKTHTMLGTDSEPGIMVRTLDDLFKEMDDTSTDSNYTVTMSYLEIYNEMIRDLLNPSSGYLDLREDSKGVVVAGLSEITALTTKDVMQMLSMGNKQRTCEPTAVNKTSSRSHAVLQVTVKQRSRLRNIIEEVKVGKLFMIDLAGSERAANTQNRGKRLIEGAHINRSLLALGNCINALCERGVRGSNYVNYRDSKLTRLLKDSLGGNCRTVMIAHISPASLCYEESKNTLNYADRAKNIKLKVKRNQYSVNYHIAQYQSIIAELRQEILRLKTKMADTDLKSQNNSASSANFRGCRESKLLEKLRAELVESFREQMEIRRQLIDVEDSAIRYSVDYQRHILTIEEWEQEKAKRLAGLNIEQLSTLPDSTTKKPHVIKKKLIYRRSKIDPLDINNKDLDTEKNIMPMRSFDEGWEPADVIAAREEIQIISLNEKDLFDQKKELKKNLKTLRKERSELEDDLPRRISCDGHREILKLLCNVHELELKNAELESIGILKDHLVQQNELNFHKQENKQKLCDEIIQMQRTIMEDNGIEIPTELEVLYQIYLQNINENELNTPHGSTATLGYNTMGGLLDLKNNNYSGNPSSVPALSTVLEIGNSKKTRRRWIDSSSDMEGEDGSRKDITAMKDSSLMNKFTIPSLLRQDTSTTFTFDEYPSTGDNAKKQNSRISVKKHKKRNVDGASSDNEAVRYRSSKHDNVLTKASKSDSKLFKNSHNKGNKNAFGISNSMNDLSLIKAPKKTNISNEDLQNNNIDEDRPKERQRSSSLDMGREKLRIRQAAQAQNNMKKSLIKKNSDNGITITQSVNKKISMDEMSVVTIDSKGHKQNGNQEDTTNFSTNNTHNFIHQTGTPAGKGQTIRKQHKAIGQDKILGFGATVPQSKQRTKKIKQSLNDGLSVSGISVVPKQLKPGHKRF